MPKLKMGKSVSLLNEEEDDGDEEKEHVFSMVYV